MKLFISKKQNGIGLIEVLIATVVIAIGLLAVASLQGGFLSSSGGSKIRSEALTLAQQKIEELKNNINLAGYNAIPNSVDIVADAANPIAGTNTSFTRSWVIDEGGSADRKYISVTVSWDNDGNPDTVNDDEKINITTEMTFIDPAKSALYALIAGSSGTAAVPSPRQNASEDVSAASESVVGTNLSIGNIADTLGVAGTDETLSINLPDNDDGSSGGSIFVYQIAPNSHFYTSTNATGIEAGVIAVFLCENSFCSHIQNHFGGVVHRIKGTVFSTSGNGLSNISVAWTSSDVHACYNGPAARTPSVGTFEYDSMPYECVNAGNCNATAEGTRTASGTDATNPGCFVDAVVSDSQINTRNVGAGGEFGDVGLLGLDYQGGGIEQVCFLEDTTDPATSPLLNTSGSDVLNENYLFAVTKRLYITRRVQRNSGSNEFKSEGINRSYDNHNFFIISRGSGATAKAQCNTNVTANSKRIAPREISRAYNENTSNAVTAEASYSGGTSTAHTLTGNITGSATDLRLFIPETGTCYLNNAQDRTTDATGYACVIASDAGNAEIIGSSNQHKNTDPSVFASCTKAANTTPGCHWLTNFTGSFNDGIANNDCTTPWGADLSDGADAVDAYSTADCGTAVALSCSAGVLSDSNAIYETSALCTTAASSASCSSPFTGGPDIPHGISVNAYSVASVAYGASCPDAISRSCSNGVLSGSGDFQSCTVDAPCSVPSIDGIATNNDSRVAGVVTIIEDAGLVADGTDNLTSNEVTGQSLVANTSVACGTNLSYNY